MGIKTLGLLENFENEINAKNNHVVFLHTLGIGAFTLFSIFEFVALLTLLLRDFLTITESDVGLIYLLPEVLSLILFAVVLYFTLIFLVKKQRLNSRKILTKSIAIFFAIVPVQFLYSFYITDFFRSKYSDAYNLYYDGFINQYQLRVYASFIPASKYIIAAIMVFYASKKLTSYS